MKKQVRVDCPTCEGKGYLDVSALRARRLSLGFTQEQVAREIGYTRSQYANVENGVAGIKAKNIRKMSSYLQLTTDELLDILYGTNERK